MGFNMAIKDFFCGIICGNEKQLILTQLEQSRKDLDAKTQQMNDWQNSCNKSKAQLIIDKQTLQGQIRQLTDECAVLQGQVDYWKQHQPVVDYWEQYYTSKHNEVDSILYSGRYDYKSQTQISCDVREFFVNPDAGELQQIVRTIKNAHPDIKTNDDFAYWAEQWVTKNIGYQYDQVEWGISEYWEFPFEVIYKKAADCEGMAILLANLMLAGGVPYWRTRINAGDVRYGQGTAGHSWVNYCREIDNRFINCDPAYNPRNTPYKDRPYWKEETQYLKIWFSFDSKHTYSDNPDKPVAGVKNIKIIK
jgi:hypothetical protein